jgi:hypothetical protein
MDEIKTKIKELNNLLFQDFPIPRIAYILMISAIIVLYLNGAWLEAQLREKIEGNLCFIKKSFVEYRACEIECNASFYKQFYFNYMKNQNKTPDFTWR